jgi:glycosyltransferase involved in cell wall biosynthesis
LALFVETMNSPLVSILLPFVNEGALLAEAIDSIIFQSFNDFEVLLIDNGADALSRKIADEAVAKDSRFRLMVEKSIGISHALNHGVREAKGAYIARMDADDRSHPERLYKQVMHLSLHPETGVVSCKAELFPVHETNEGYREFVSWQNGISSAEEHFTQRFIESPLAHPTVMMRKELFEQWGYYSTDPVPEDYELWLRWMKNKVRFEKIPETLFYWRDRAERLSRTHTHYSDDAFSKIKSIYLAEWLRQHVDEQKKIIACGSSKHINSKINLLEKEGIVIHGVTDLKPHPENKRPFIPTSDLSPSSNVFVINLIARRDLRESIRDFLKGKGFQEAIDFIMAG